MSADSSAFDPYRTPALPEKWSPPPTKSGRPGGLTAVCVICIVIGALGLLNGLFGAVGTIFGEQLQSAFTAKPGPGMPAEMQKIQQQFQDETLAVQEKFFVSILISSIFRMVIAAGLLMGGIACLSLKENGRQILIYACLAAVVFEIAHAVLQSLVNMEMMTALNAFMEGMMQSLPQRGAGPSAGVMRTIMQGSFMVGIVIAYLISLLKVVFYAWCCWYLQRQTTKTLFVTAAPTHVAVLS